METPAPFDLNNAIQRWRENLATSPAFRAENLDELEAHLRDSVGAFVAKGLSEDEAWWIAIRRFGFNNSVSEEFEKLNANRIWLDRAAWLVGGSVLISLLSMSAVWLSNLSILISSAFGVSGNVVGLVGSLVHPTVLFAVTLLAYRFAVRSKPGKRRAWEWIAAHPAWFALLLLLLPVIGAAIAALLNFQLLKTMNQRDYGTVMLWRLWSNLPTMLVWPSVLAWLLWRRSRTKEFAA
jgi:hypothetical protein